MRYTPSNIDHLEDGEIFVFGSNESGIHGAGAAKLAFDKFGAVWKVGVGHEGKTYAIPTKDYVIKTLDLEEINDYVKEFLIYAEKNPDFTFLVTEIGCGLAGYTPKDIAPMFRGYPLNVILPESFVDILRSI
jgi:hypothetical protein